MITRKGSVLGNISGEELLHPLLIASAEETEKTARFGPARTISRRVGRVQTMILSYIIGVRSLLSLVLVKTSLSNGGIFVILSSLMYAILISATGFLEECLFMDYSPRRQHARWMSFDSVVEFAQCSGEYFLTNTTIKWLYLCQQLFNQSV